eukprot:307867-Hanusia_phi.AAC.1
MGLLRFHPTCTCVEDGDTSGATSALATFSSFVFVLLNQLPKSRGPREMSEQLPGFCVGRETFPTYQVLLDAEAHPVVEQLGDLMVVGE